jgi:hypothetical protein
MPTKQTINSIFNLIMVFPHTATSTMALYPLCPQTVSGLKLQFIAACPESEHGLELSLIVCRTIN